MWNAESHPLPSTFRFALSAFRRRIPPFDPGSIPSEGDIRRGFDLSDPVPEMGCVVDDQRGAVLRENIFKEPVEEYIPVHLLHRFTILPWRRPDKTVIRPLTSPVKEVASEAVFEVSKRFNALHDIRQGDPFAKILKQPVGE